MCYSANTCFFVEIISLNNLSLTPIFNVARKTERQMCKHTNKTQGAHAVNRAEHNKRNRFPGRRSEVGGLRDRAESAGMVSTVKERFLGEVSTELGFDRKVNICTCELGESTSNTKTGGINCIGRIQRR